MIDGDLRETSKSVGNESHTFWEAHRHTLVDFGGLVFPQIYSESYWGSYVLQV